MGEIAGESPSERERKTIVAADAFRDALYEMDARLSEQFKKDGLRALDATNAATSAMAGLLAAYSVFAEGEGMSAERFEDAIIGTLRRNVERLKKETVKPKH